MRDREQAVSLDRELRDLRDALLAAEVRRDDELRQVHPCHRSSARNLLHYLELRRHDVRELQRALAVAGLSSLGRTESHVLASIDAVIGRLTAGPPPVPHAGAPSMAEGRALLDANAERLLGPAREARPTRIMITLPSEAATDPAIARAMVGSGMDVARVNCAHDAPEAWTTMLEHLRASADGPAPRVAMDLGGPKLRTGPIAPGPRVRRIAPTRDARGRVVEPALLALRAGTPSWVHATHSGALPVADAAWVARRVVGDEISIIDSRGAKRAWQVVEISEGGCLVSIEQTTFVEAGATLVVRAPVDDAAVVGELPEIEQAIRVRHGDHVVLTRDLTPVHPTPGATAHRIGCTLPEVFEHARPGERIWLDDGKIGGTIVRVDADELEIRITDVRPGGANLKGGKGINLPDTDLGIPALTEKDRRDLAFVARHADLVNYSFVREADDVDELRLELDRLGSPDLGIVLKIENARAFENLPDLLLAALRGPNVGVMIARGDLAVEVGFERLAEVQEEILWLCEAAHVPVIWATQVLDTMARTGRASRAEVTDAAMAERAECVMLNKGPFIIEALEALDSILRRMHHHQDKKRSLLRRLRSWDAVEPVPVAGR